VLHFLDEAFISVVCKREDWTKNVRNFETKKKSYAV
jgi:hypothetical protein